MTMLKDMLKGQDSFDVDTVDIIATEVQLESFGWPDALIKACCDVFEFELQLRTGTVIRFSHARPVNREWVHIVLDDVDQKHSMSRCPRGIDVRVADIVYVADAPDGS